MSAIDPVLQPTARPAPSSSGAVEVLSAVGVAFLVYQSIGWIGWIADGPVQLTKYRDTASLSWKICKLYECLAVITAIAVARVVVRECVRERQLTFDALFCLACFTLFWQDPMANFFQPLFLWSQNWINLNDWMGYLPWSPNPDAGRSAEPILNDGLNYLVAWLAFAMVLNRAMQAWEARHPGGSRGTLVAIAFALGAVTDILLEAPMYWFDTWQFPGSPDVGFWADTGHKFPAYEFVSGAIMFSLVASIRYFRDANGLRFPERGLERYPRRMRKTLTFLAMAGLFNTVYLADNAVYMFLGTHSGTYKPMPAHIVGGTCDAPGITGTRYGPCPGSEGYRMPLRGSLPGTPPGGEPRWLNGPTQCETCAPVVVDPTVAR